MSACFIFIDRLKGGQTQKFDELLDPAFLGPEEPELKFQKKVHVKGEAYLTDDHLIVTLKAETQVTMPCSICNEMIPVDLKISNLTHTEPLEEIKGAKFDFRGPLREALLLELPRTVECKGKCPERESIAPYIREKDRVNFPFADMDKN